MFILSCASDEGIRLPPDLEFPELYNSADPIETESDYWTLVGMDIRWRRLMNTCRLITGEIDAEEWAEEDRFFDEMLEGLPAGPVID